jgi:very-short-patch-repair endonuclease
MDDLDLFRLSERQHNHIARRQARDLGFDRWALAHRIRRGDWTPVSPRVLRRTGAALDLEGPLMAAVLDAGPDAMASHEAAAWLWGLPGFGPTVDVTRDRTVADGDQPHRPRLLLPHHRTEVRGVPVTSLPVTVFHLAGAGLPYARLARIVATVIGRSPGLVPAFDRTLEELAERGRPGITVMRAVLSQQDRSGVKTTGLERRFEAILRNAGEAPMERQVDVGGHSWIGRVDYIDRVLGLIVEVDSLTFHSSQADQLRDGVRDDALLAAGCRKVLRIAEEWVWHEPHRAVAEVRAARNELRTSAA